ncbi:MAG: hypothetical protein J5972_03765 [Eubacterium sp.]|nr:hypothetical protein [Eubacterium sp.]
MAYEDIYKGLNEEEKQRMLKMDIPKFVSTGEICEISDEEKKQEREKLMKLIEQLK